MTRKLLPVWITLFSILLLGTVAWRASAASATVFTATATATYAAVTVEESLPDLVITDMWNEGDQIWYQIWNAGDVAAQAGHYTRLRVDGLQQTGDADYIDVALAPGERLKRAFTRSWVCSSPQDTVEVCADYESTVGEDDETNNCREETWPCDTTPPQITSGPTISTTTTTQAVIIWQTDEDSDSVVRYGKQAGIYDLEKQDPSPVQAHLVTLTGLDPSTVYHYVVQSTDPSSNTVASKEGFFETAPLADGEPPIVSSFQITHVGKERYEFAAEASDNVGVERIEFYLDGELIWIDYTPSSPYRAPLAPSRLDMTREEFYSQHTATAVAVDRNGNELTDHLDDPFTPADEDMDVTVVFRAPSADYTIYTDAATVPSDTFVEIEVHAVQYVWECRYVPDPRGGFEFCADRAQDVARVEFYVDGDLKHTSNFPQTRHIHSYDWDAGGLSAGTQHTISVTVVASDGSEHYPTPPRTVSIVRAQPHIWVRRTVSRIGNYFDVELTVGNSGVGNAEVAQIRDNLTGFQPISKTEGAEYTVNVTYDPNTMLSTATIDFLTGKTIAPGESLRVAYLAVPILHPDLEDDAYVIGGEEVSVSYTDSAGSQVEALDLPCQVTSDDELLAEAVGLAVREADYLIVTNPTYLFFFNANNDDVNALLSTMAHLARLKAGVLGHLTDEHRTDPDSGRAQIREWGSVMKREDGTPNGYLYSGYLLIVGESEIVGSYFSKHKTGYSLWTETRRVRWTDLPYGNTAGAIEKPELAVGRIIGNNARELVIPLQTSINVYLQETGFEFDRSDALAISGPGPGAVTFEQNMEKVAEILEQESSVVKLKWREVGNFAAEFRQHDANKDVIFYRDHCSPNSWSGGIDTGDFTGVNPIDFADSKPFVFACCCSSGRYEDDGENGHCRSILKARRGGLHWGDRGFDEGPE